ncbi:hypothetical protein FRC07_001587 [Ceratobasidium sp. 392]|nr:hypothetical protein FRC07_001587 [Ceratobasidium sp. 392]
MNARSTSTATSLSSSSYTKFNSSPAPSYDVLAPDTYASSRIVTTSARRRVGSSDDNTRVIDPWGDTGVSGASTSSASNGRQGLRARSRSHSKANGNGEGHPLQASVSGKSTTAETRPGLQRMLSSKDSKGALWGLTDGWVEEDGEQGTETSEGAPTPGSREMLVHKIQPKDSLAGVALRYGVSLADIRRVNKLWAGDSIHLRSVLYIPLTANLKLGYASNLIDLRTPNKERNAELSSETSASADDASSSATPTPAPDAPTIQHVPASELSFFPPPTISPRKPAAHARTVPRGSVSPFTASSPLLFSPGLSTSAQLFSPHNSQLSVSPSKGTGTLSSIFSSIPLPDTIQRLSLDSIAGGTLTPRALSSVSDLSDQLVELNTLGARQTATTRPKRTIRTQPAPGPVMTVPKRSVEDGNVNPSSTSPSLGALGEDW